MDKQAVGSVDLDGLEAGLMGASRRVPEGGDQTLDVGFRHLQECRPAFGVRDRGGGDAADSGHRCR